MMKKNIGYIVIKQEQNYYRFLLKLANVFNDNKEYLILDLFTLQGTIRMIIVVGLINMWIYN